MMREPNRFARAWRGMTAARFVCAAGASLLLVACQQGGTDDAQTSTDAKLPDASSTGAYDGIAEDETVRFTGTEPFWGGEVRGGALTYTTPDNPEGAKIAVER